MKLGIAWATLNNWVKTHEDILITLEGTTSMINYSVRDGEPKLNIEPIFKDYGFYLTDLGQKVYEHIRKQEIEAQNKIWKP